MSSAQARGTPPTYRMYIDGAWCDASNGATYDLPNPATEAIVARVPNATRADMERAIAAARRAFDDGPWPRTSRHDRAKMIRRIIDGMEKRKEDLRQLLIIAAAAEYVSHPIQLDLPFELLANYADLALSFEFEKMLPTIITQSPMGAQAVSAMAYHQPVGVCGMIPTWNFPLFVSVQKLGPALAAGCTMIFKPSPYMPLIDLALAEIIEECDLPKGVFNVVTGESPDLGALLVESPLVDKISYTGSVATGKRIMAAAAGTLKRVHLELGGKSAAIVLDDADLDLVAPYTSGPSFFHAGQGCAMCTRVMVPASKHDAVVERLANFVNMIVKIGDPADPTVMLGPVIRAERRAKIEEYIESGKQQGAVLATGGGRPADLPKGYFLQPTIFGGVRNDMRIAREEIFGPVLSVMPFKDEDDAIRIANDSPYGLGGAIYSADRAKVIAMAKRIRTGTLNINGAVSLIHLPFGGFKDSGIGREGGWWGVNEYTEIQAIAWT
ncbi:MAG: aldehyde dehydrogenase family protein [Deltaproteobacteria bacterium]|nr:aldehyde dehydrogenase family protein [Deltaproteobacteria bacterium]MBI3389345.1 aldehyde dehydrogenase family protein [Deltaproteobacteria bacterium]